MMNIVCIFSLLTILVEQSTFSHGIVFNFPLSGDEGTFSSPNYPQPYPLNANCTWTIETSVDKRIRINFIDFRLEKNKVCLYDYLRITEYSPQGKKVSSKYCGYNGPQIFYSSGSKVQVNFVSDSLSQVERGFKAAWKILSKEDVDYSGSPLATILPCPANLVTVTVTKKATCAIPKHALKPSRCLCSTAAQKTIYRTVFVNNPNREIIHNKNHNHHSVINNIIQPSVQVGNNLPQWQKRSNKCNESFAVQTNPAKADGSNKTGLLIAFGCLVGVLLVSNIILLVILCRKDGKKHIITHTNHLVKCLPAPGQQYNQPRSPDIYYYPVNRPTLGVLNGDTIIVPGDKRSHRIQTSPRPDTQASVELPTRTDSNTLASDLSVNNCTRFPFHLISPTSRAETGSIDSDLNDEETRRSAVFSSASEPESEY